MSEPNPSDPLESEVQGIGDEAEVYLRYLDETVSVSTPEAVYNDIKLVLDEVDPTADIFRIKSKFGGPSGFCRRSIHGNTSDLEVTLSNLPKDGATVLRARRVARGSSDSEADSKYTAVTYNTDTKTNIVNSSRIYHRGVSFRDLLKSYYDIEVMEKETTQQP